MLGIQGWCCPAVPEEGIQMKEMITIMTYTSEFGDAAFHPKIRCILTANKY